MTILTLWCKITLMVNIMFEFHNGVDVVLCDDVKCSSESHAKEVDTFYNNIVASCPS